MKSILSKIFDACNKQFDEIVEIRRKIHMYPELGFEVQKTAAVAESELKKLGIEVKTGVGKIGVVGDFNIPNATKRIALRADMDALPILEQGDACYKSRVDGVAHMCGHDVHTAILIGAARLIKHFKDELKANIRFIFQPSEERLPGGAIGMIDDGVLEGVDEIYGLHVWNAVKAGQFAICPGAFLGQPDAFEIEIIGKGGHGGMPHQSVDPILTGCQFVSMLQSIVSRNIDPLESSVISVTQFNGGSSFNIIPSLVKIAGTVRTLKKEVQAEIRDRIENMLSGITSAQGADYNLVYTEGYPVTYNHESCTNKALSVAKKLVGESNVIFPHPPVLAGDDFGYYSQKIPAAMISLGAGNTEIGFNKICHDPEFDVDERCIIYGMAFYLALAMG